jgi:hypothetical protein
MKTIYMLWSEWDIGESSTAFVSKDVGRRWLLENEALKEMAEDDKEDINSYMEQLFDEGYFSWTTVELLE